jgi:hypothetical protein
MVDVTGLVVAAFVLLSVLFGFLAFRLFKRPFNLTDTQLSFIDDEHQTDRIVVAGPSSNNSYVGNGNQEKTSWSSKSNSYSPRSRSPAIEFHQYNSTMSQKREIMSQPTLIRPVLPVNSQTAIDDQLLTLSDQTNDKAKSGTKLTFIETILGAGFLRKNEVAGFTVKHKSRSSYGSLGD